jgi:hypothetical protein
LAEDFRFQSAAVCTTEEGSEVAVPPGVYLAQETYDRIEAEYKKSQDRVTRLEAENTALKNYTLPPTTTLIVGALSLGAGIWAGYYIWK